jgi:PAS domain S-box-containing protein
MSEDNNLKYLAEIEARKLAQRGLKEGQNFLQGILSSLEDTFIVVFDKEGLINFVWGPISLEERYGIKFQEYMGKGTADFLRSIPNEEKLKIINNVFNTLTPVRMEFSMSMPNGMIWVDISVSPLVDNEVGILAVIVAARDITKRKKAEQELKESEQRYRAQFEEAFDAIFIAEPETGIIVDCNIAATELVGKDKSDIIGQHQKTINSPETIKGGFSEGFVQHRSEKKGQIIEARVITKNGDLKDVAITSSLIKIKGTTLMQGIFRDITDRKKAEVELKESEEKFRLIAEQSIVGLIIIKDSKFLFVNAKLCEITGYSEEELLTWNVERFLQRIHPVDLPSIIIAMKNRVEDKNLTSSFELRFKQKSGKYIWLQQNANPIQLKGEMAVLSVLIDITEQKRAEKTVEESEKRYRTIFQTVPYGIQLTDLEGKITYSNAAHHNQIHRVKEGSLIGEYVWDFAVSEVEQKRTKEYYEEIIKNPIKPGPYFTTNRLHDGSHIDIQVDWDYMRDTNDEIIGICSVISDITDKNKRINELKESEEKFRLIFENIRDGIVGLNEEGNIEFANITAAKNLGYELDEFLKLNIFDISNIEQENAFKKHFSDMMEGRRLNFESVHRKKDGTLRNVEVLINSFELKEKIMSLAIWHDITDIKRAEEALKENEGIMRSILENSPDHILMVDENSNIQFINRPLPGKKLEDIINQNILNIIPPQYQKLVKDRIEQIFSVGKAEKTIITLPSGTLLQSFYEIRFGFIKRDWKTIAAIVILTDVTEQKHQENLLRVQRDLATALNGESNFHEGLSLCLEAAIKCSQMDCGGIYLFDKISGSLDLISHKGLPIGFVRDASHYEPDSKNAILISKGEPLYTFYQNLDLSRKDLHQIEHLLAIAVIPIKYQNKIIGCLNIASHIHEEVPQFSRVALEIISSQIGTAIMALQNQGK